MVQACADSAYIHLAILRSGCRYTKIPRRLLIEFYKAQTSDQPIRAHTKDNLAALSVFSFISTKKNRLIRFFYIYILTKVWPCSKIQINSHLGDKLFLVRRSFRQRGQSDAGPPVEQSHDYHTGHGHEQQPHPRPVDCCRVRQTREAAVLHYGPRDGHLQEHVRSCTTETKIAKVKV